MCTFQAQKPSSILLLRSIGEPVLRRTGQQPNPKPPFAHSPAGVRISLLGKDRKCGRQRGGRWGGPMEFKSDIATHVFKPTHYRKMRSRTGQPSQGINPRTRENTGLWRGTKTLKRQRTKQINQAWCARLCASAREHAKASRPDLMRRALVDDTCLSRIYRSTHAQIQTRKDMSPEEHELDNITFRNNCR